MARKFYSEWPSIPVPACLQKPGWVDASYHNDVCARSEFRFADGSGLTVWVEHASRKKREYPEWGRYIVNFSPDLDDNPGEVELYNGDSVKDLERALRTAIELHGPLARERVTEAAPELLSALRNLRDVLKATNWVPPQYFTLKSANAAIAKARGES